MKPRDLMLAALEAHIIPFMQEQGFRFSPSQLKFARKVGKVKQTIDISLNRHNLADNCAFWSIWSASAPEYLKWHEKEWNEKGRSDSLGSLADWNIPGWSRKPEDISRTLLNRQEDAEVMARFRADIQNAGLPFLARISTWEGAAAQFRKERWCYDRAADYLLMAGKREEAKATLLEGIHAFEAEGRNDALRELPGLKRRLARYFQ